MTFIRLRDVTTPRDAVKAYQVEVVKIRSGRVTKRYVTGKPNVVNQTFSVAMDMLDPRIDDKDAFNAA